MKRFLGAAAIAFLIVAGCSVIDGLDVGAYDGVSHSADGGANACTSAQCAAGQICCNGGCIPSTQTCGASNTCASDSQCASGQICGIQQGSGSKTCLAPYAQVPSGLTNGFSPASSGYWSQPAANVDGGAMERVVVTDNQDSATNCTNGAVLNPVANTQYAIMDMYEQAAPGIDAGPTPTTGAYAVHLPDAGITQALNAHVYNVFYDGQCTAWRPPRFEANGGTLNLTSYNPQDPTQSASGNYSISTPAGGTAQQGQFAVRGCNPNSAGSACQHATGAPTGTGSITSGSPTFTVNDAITMPQRERAGQKYVVIMGQHATQCGGQILAEQYQGDVDVVLDVWNEDATKGPLVPTATGTYTIMSGSTPPGPGLYARAVYVASTAGTCTPAAGGHNSASSGSVSITGIGAGGNLTGTFSISWSGGTSSTGSFTTGWCGWRGTADGQGGINGGTCVP